MILVFHARQQGIALGAAHLGHSELVGAHDVDVWALHEPPGLLGIQRAAAHPPGSAVDVDPLAIMYRPWPGQPTAAGLWSTVATGADLIEPPRPLPTHEAMITPPNSHHSQ